MEPRLGSDPEVVCNLVALSLGLLQRMRTIFFGNGAHGHERGMFGNSREK